LAIRELRELRLRQNIDSRKNSVPTLLPQAELSLEIRKSTKQKRQIGAPYWILIVVHGAL
jgi:hypothetical protein